MRLAHATWLEVEAYLRNSRGIILPTGSTEQHGPMGLIGTDALCAEAIATRVGDRAKALVAPTLTYTPAPFNTAFPGTLSLSAPLFQSMVQELLQGLLAQGFAHVYILNGHGANLAPLNRAAAAQLPALHIRIRSWWDFTPVNALREAYYGTWEGMHGTPSEVAVTQALHRVVPAGPAQTPPQHLSPGYIRDHAGDRHGPPEEHRRDFPDGRVGSHSALASPEQGQALLAAAVQAITEDYQAFVTTEGPPAGS